MNCLSEFPESEIFKVWVPIRETQVEDSNFKIPRAAAAAAVAANLFEG